MIDALALLEPGKDLRFFLRPVGREEFGYRLADDLVRAVTEMRSAALFQLLIVPLRSLEIITSSDESTIAA